MWLGIASLSAVLTGSARRYALRTAMLDVPSERSSHQIPTPRGGGVAIIAAALGGIVLLAVLQVIQPQLTVGLLGGGALVGAVGWVDDRRGLAARTRFVAHLIAALWFLGWTNAFATLSIGQSRWELGWLGLPLAALVMVWFINLYNFMDGIDGIAAGEAVSVGTAAAVMLLALGHFNLAAVALCVSGAATGFLIWNWPPAKIFMGDSGSGLLGFLFIALAFSSERAGAIPLTAWIAMLGVFFFDATVTLLRRMLRRERWREPHRAHAYQRAARKTGSHLVTTIASVILTFVLCLLAWWITVAPQHVGLGLGAAVAVLAGSYWLVETVAPMSSGESAGTAPPGRVVA
jgi:Fuc2NAc and GlcNAc transferase